MEFTRGYESVYMNEFMSDEGWDSWQRESREGDGVWKYLMKLLSTCWEKWKGVRHQQVQKTVTSIWLTHISSVKGNEWWEWVNEMNRWMTEGRTICVTSKGEGRWKSEWEKWRVRRERKEQVGCMIMMTTGDPNSSNLIPYALQGSKLFARRVLFGEKNQMGFRM